MVFLVMGSIEPIIGGLLLIGNHHCQRRLSASRSQMRRWMIRLGSGMQCAFQTSRFATQRLALMRIRAAGGQVTRPCQRPR